MESLNQEGTSPLGGSSSSQEISEVFDGVLTDQTTPASHSTKPIVSSACTACRARHLKCDGSSPCSRCISYGLDCQFVKSRRGYKGPRRNLKQAVRTANEGTSPGHQSIAFDSGASEQSLSIESTDAPSLLDPSLEFNDSQLIGRPFPSSEIAPRRPLSHPNSSAIKNRCFEAFFHYGHPAHPFILPKQRLQDLLQSKPLPHLEAALCFWGSFFMPLADTAFFEQEAIRLVESDECPQDGFLVQALLACAIAFDGMANQKKSLEMLARAEDLALEIGLNQRHFATDHGECSRVLEESWRRTWWELYVVSGFIAGLHQQSSFRLFEVPTSVLLPCQESDYLTERIPQSFSLDDFDDDFFHASSVSFSSFAYRIAAVRDLGRVLKYGQNVFTDDPIIARLDTHLANWHFHLPESKRLGINENGQIDEMIFQGIMINNGASILLHQRHSQLDTSVANTVVSCAPHIPVNSGTVYNPHAAKIISAAANIGELIKLPVPATKHTHFFACVITLASIVHLSCWALQMPMSIDDDIKQSIRLSTGALKAISQVWPNAGCATNQVQAVAKKIFSDRRLAAEEGFWNAWTEEEVRMTTIEDQDIINLLT